MIDSDFEEIGEIDIQLRLARGDFHDPLEISNISKWLKKKDKERKFLALCKQASISAALDASINAKRANYIALSALIIAVISNYQQIKNFINPILNSIKV